MEWQNYMYSGPNTRLGEWWVSPASWYGSWYRVSHQHDTGSFISMIHTIIWSYTKLHANCVNSAPTPCEDGDSIHGEKFEKRMDKIDNINRRFTHYHVIRKAGGLDEKCPAHGPTIFTTTTRCPASRRSLTKTADKWCWRAGAATLIPRLLIGTLLSLGLCLAVLVRVMSRAVNEIQNFTMPRECHF